MITSRVSIFLGALGTLAVGCSSSSTGSGVSDGGAESGALDASEAVDAESADGAAETGAADAAGDASSGGNDITGTYGTEPIKPIVAAFWIGMPGNPNESGGGPFIYLFSGPVSCADLSKGSGWLTTIPAGTQVLELIVGTTNVGAAGHAAANVVEANYAFGGSATEARATAGNVTLTAYAKDVAVDGTVDLTFPSGQAKGTVHAVWCAAGHEL
jgi:hypothetical protein